MIWSSKVNKELSPDLAALKIQKWWRSYIDKSSIDTLSSDSSSSSSSSSNTESESEEEGQSEVINFVPLVDLLKIFNFLKYIKQFIVKFFI